MSVGENTHFGCAHTSEEDILDTILERQSESEGEVAEKGGYKQHDLHWVAHFERSRPSKTGSEPRVVCASDSR